MDTFEQKEMKKKIPIQIILHDWLINYIPEPIRKGVGGFNDKVVRLFKKNTLKGYGKQTVYGRTLFKQ